MRREHDVWLRLILAAGATWRLAHLLAYEDGPADIIARIRAHVGSGFLGALMDCFQCLSLWVAAPIAWLTFQRPRDRLLGWLGLSGAACLLERLGREPVVIQPMSSPQGEGVTADDVLRSEPRDDQKRVPTDPGVDLGTAGL